MQASPPSSEPSVRDALEYLRRFHVAAGDLVAVTGVSAPVLAALHEAGVTPAPTYEAGPRGVRSAIGGVGVVEPGEPIVAYYGPSVVCWLRRAAVIAEGVGPAGAEAALRAWLLADLRAELAVRAADAEAFGWSELLHGGSVNSAALDRTAAQFWVDWMNGGWAVCLRRFDARHLLGKEIERRRIAALMDEGRRLSPEQRLALFDAMVRLDTLLMPFAPHERATGTPGRFIDRPAAALGMAWSRVSPGA